MVYHNKISVSTRKRAHWVDITDEIQSMVASSTIQQGICIVVSLHTTGGITLNENADPDVEHDFFLKINQLVPCDPAFRHSEGNSDSHLKTSLVGLSVQLPITNGRILLGTWQSIYFCEFDGPRSRQVAITIIGE